MGDESRNDNEIDNRMGHDQLGGRDRAERVRQWYRNKARAFLDEFTPERVHEFDRDQARIDALESTLGEERPVCFVGHSGVGKSTLINTLVADTRAVLPQGGIGPLTAQATCVRWAKTPSFRATYLPPTKLNQVVFGLERHHEHRFDTTASTPDAVPDGQIELDPEDRKEIQADATEIVGEGSSDRINALIRQASLLVRGSTVEVDLTYLADCLRVALAQNTRYGHEPRVEDRPRIDALRQALARARTKKQYVQEGEVTDLGFRNALHDHAAGHLAPLIESLEVGWNSPVLSSGLTLVDLPGLGIANDQYRNVTQAWVRNKAKAIALVVDRAGITEESAELLRASGFIGRLLHAADDPTADAVQLLVVAVKLDLTADDEWSAEKQNSPDNARRWVEHFASVQKRMEENLGAQFREQVVGALRQGSFEEVSQDIDRVAEHLMESLSIYTVSAPQFRKLAIGDDEDRPRIQEPCQSGIPQLRKAIAELAKRREERIENGLIRVVDQFVERVFDTLSVVRLQWESETRPVAEAEQLRSELESFLSGPSGPRRELHSRQGAFREFLKETIPERIRDLVEEAGHQAEGEIRTYLADLKHAHWATLRATVRRGGTFLHGISRQVDIPNDFAVRIDEPVGLVWSKRILSAIRKRTTDLGTDYISLVDRVVHWASEQDPELHPEPLNALQKEVRSDMRELNAVGKEKVDDLRQAVRQQLLQRIKGPIRQRCNKFVAAHQDVGPGVKMRMLDLFDNLVPTVMETAKRTATNVLLSNFQAVETQIRDIFDQHQDPIERAAEAIVVSEKTSREREDAPRRDSVLQRIHEVTSTAPGPDNGNGATAA